MSTGESTSDITEGTYRALCKHGYADVTMEDIAAETDVSKSALHYHYDSKHDLLVSFFQDLLEGFTERLDAVEGETAYESLLNLIDAVLFPPDDDAPDLGFQTAVLEMKAQGPYDESFRRYLKEHEHTLREHVEDHLADGVESGEFRADLDVEASADFLVTVFNGAQTRSVAVGRPVEETRETLRAHIDSMIVADGGRK
ncbi:MULTISPECIES: TetR/AcrR family transcriptional regulator [Halolamina]|uniref:Transcriptional regulator, TetR family n=1 Tax=Halolamina pelagica TaxID=699431 RepID=A0A1I5MWE8_9EURY|nr:MULTISPECIES: TetR/AcrR family transcriptional regulator [Halolamina]NHX36173.1 TetR/AcrR family transcriptional regulator [Halolamina sp. R1-12]SFP13426.1 transcriptional regulator, TetR family [Halolamina pelagica]